MPGREVRVKEVLKDIQSGMDEEYLRKKYKLSPQGLQNLFRELSDLGLLERIDFEDSATPRIRIRIRIRIRDVVKDIRAGLSDLDLRKKYNLSANGLHLVFKKLLDLKAIDAEALFGIESARLQGTGKRELREEERYALDFDIPSYNTAFPEIHGRVRDVSENGIGLFGVKAKEGDLTHIVVLGDTFGFVGPLEFEAECRWTKTDGASGEYLTGFLITDITDWDLEELKKLIRLLTLAD